MSYVFSFEKKQLIQLAALLAVIGIFLLAAGFLVGRLSASPAGNPSVLPASLPATLPLPAQTALPPQATPTATSVDAKPTPLTGLSASAPATAPEGKPVLAGFYTLQFGSFADKADAQQLVTRLAARQVIATVQPVQNPLGKTAFAVRAGIFNSTAEASAAAEEQAALSGSSVQIKSVR